MNRRDRRTALGGAVTTDDLMRIALDPVGYREAFAEARRPSESDVHRRDAFLGPEVVEARALVLAQAGEAEAALGEIEQALEVSHSGEVVKPILHVSRERGPGPEARRRRAPPGRTRRSLPGGVDR
jgi:hypothetical protein